MLGVHHQTVVSLVGVLIYYQLNILVRQILVVSEFHDDLRGMINVYSGGFVACASGWSLILCENEKYKID